MSDRDYIAQAVDENPGLYAEIEKKLAEVLDNPGDVTALSSVITATATNYAANITAGGGMSLPVLAWTSKGNVLLSTTVEIMEGEDPLKAVAMAIAAQATVNMLTAAGAAVSGTLGAPFLIAVGTTVAGIIAAETVGDLVNEGWDYILGPSVKSTYDPDFDSITITSRTGSISNILRHHWEESLQGRNLWRIVSDEDNEEISYKEENNLFTFSKSLDEVMDSNVLLAGNENDGRLGEVLGLYRQDTNIATSDYTSPLPVKTFYLSEAELKGLVDDKRAFFAMQNLRPFVLEGIDDYLSVEPSRFSDQYKEDRARFLYHRLNENALSSDGQDTSFSDRALTKTAYAGNGVPDAFDQLYVFGKDDEGDFITGNQFANDHLYGRGGDDRLFGNSGDDYLEGGQGHDILNGGLGDDVFYVSGNDLTYDDFEGSYGYDKIVGSDRDDFIRVHDFTGHDIEEIDGGAGIDTLAGTSGDDTLDITTLKLTNLEKIDTGAGEDTVQYSEIPTGSSLTSLDGGSGYDTLQGSIGPDTFDLTGTALDITNFEQIDLGLGDDTLRVKNLSIADFDQIDGGWGTDRIEGTDEADIIDLRGITVAGMEEIQGGGGNDILYGASGALVFDGGAGDDLMAGGDGADTYIVEGHDVIRDSGRNSIIYQGQVLAGGFVREGTSNTYHFLGDRNISLTFNSPGHLVLSDTDSITFQQQTSAADFANGDFGFTLYEPTEAGWTLTGTATNDYPLFTIDQGSAHYVFSGNINNPNVHGYLGDASWPMFGYSTLAVPPSLQIDGAGGNDWLMGLAGADIIDGGDGNDRIIGDGFVPDPDPRYNPWGDTGAADILQGGAGTDYISGGYGEDLISGGGDQDFLDGGSGNDTVGGDQGDDVLAGGLGDDMLSGGSGSDYLYGDSNIQPSFPPGGYEDSLHQIDLGSLGVEAEGFDGYPVWVTFHGFDLAEESGDGGDDLIYGGFGNDLLTGGSGNDSLWGEADQDTLIGGSGGDILDGGAGNDWLLGDDSDIEGNDKLYGGAGVDELSGDGGDDFLDGGSGDDFLDGGYGNDTLLGGSGNDYIWDIEGDDVLDGGVGDDELEGGSGNDVYLFGRGSGKDIVYDRNGVADGGGFDLDNVDTIRFGADIAPTDMVVEQIDGDLSFSIRGTADSLTVSNWFYGGGSNRIERLEFSDGTALDISNAEAVLAGTASDDVLTGTEWDDLLVGGGGNDTLVGGLGNDVLIGGVGSTLDGGEGDDTLVLDDTGKVSLGLVGLPTTVLAGGYGRDTYFIGPHHKKVSIVEHPNLLGGIGNSIEFGQGINQAGISLGIGSLLIRTGLPGDEIHIANFNPEDVYGEQVIETFRFADGTVLSYVELLEKGFDLEGTEADDVISGTNVVDRISGLAGNDTLSGGAGNDTLDGGPGDDTLLGGVGDDRYLFQPGGGCDRIEDGQGDDTLALGNGLAVSDMGADRSGNDLILRLQGTGDAVELADWFIQAPGSGVNSILFEDGSSLDRQGVEALLNGPPAVNNDRITVYEDGGPFSFSANELLANDTDPDPADMLTVTAVGQSDAGAEVSFVDGQISYDTGTGFQELAEGEVLQDHFSYMVSDSNGATAQGVVQVDIVGINDTPLVTNDTAVTIEDSTLPVQGNVLANDADVDHGAMLAVVDQGEHQGGYGTLSLAADGSFSYNLQNESAAVQGLADGHTLTDQFTYRVTDGTATDSAVLEITVAGLNDAPVASSDTGQVAEDGILQATGNVLVNDVDKDQGTVLSVAEPGEHQGEFGTLTLLADGDYAYTLQNESVSVQALAEGQVARDQFTYSITDGSASAVGLLQMTVSGINDAPVPMADSANLVEDAVLSASGNVLANDADVDYGTSLDVVDFGTHEGRYGTLSLAEDGSYIYDLNNESSVVQSMGRGVQAIESFDYVATDGLACGSSALEITLNGVNDSPLLAAALADQRINFNKDFSWQLPQGSFGDPDQGDTLDYSATLADGSALPNWLSFDAPTQTFSGRAPKQSGVMEVKVTATDRVTATNSTEGSLSISDVFQLAVSHGNEGVGNGEDGPPPGHAGNCNDGPGTAPGTPGHRRRHHQEAGIGRWQLSKICEENLPGSDLDKARQEMGNSDEWRQPRRERAYLDASHWERKRNEGEVRSRVIENQASTFGHWLSMDLAVSRALADTETLSWLDERLGADPSAISKKAGGFLGSSTAFGTDCFSLLPSKELEGFKGLEEGLRDISR